MQRIAGLLVATVVFACGDSASSGGSSAGGSPAGGSPAGGAAAGGSSAGGAGGQGQGGAGGGAAGGGSCVDTSALGYEQRTEGMCLDNASANVFCGFGSDGAICEFSVGCAISSDLGQCQINCEQGSASYCNDEAAVACVVDAFCAGDCAALSACPFIL